MLGICFLHVLAAFVLAATGANAVGQASFTAFAIDHVGDGYVVVGTTHVSSGLGCFLLWQWHDDTSIVTVF